MPYKHQEHSYRIWNNRRWEAWGDFLEKDAKIEAHKITCTGGRVRTVKIGCGMVRLFVPVPSGILEERDAALSRRVPSHKGHT